MIANKLILGTVSSFLLPMMFFAQNNGQSVSDRCSGLGRSLGKSDHHRRGGQRWSRWSQCVVTATGGAG